MTQDVYSQLSRRITEAQHPADLERITREAVRLAMYGGLTEDESDRLTGEFADKRIELINGEVSA